MFFLAKHIWVCHSKVSNFGEGVFMKKTIYMAVALGILALIIYFIARISYKPNREESMVNITIEDARAQIEKILNTKADFFPDEGVVKVNFPRNDIKVSIDTWPLNPFMGLTSWVAFQKGSKKGAEVMAMGDLVLLENEITSAMRTALKNGIKITALHNHFLYDTPKVYFMHLDAEGTVQGVTQEVAQTLEAIKNVPPRVKAPLPTRHAIKGEPLEKIIGVKGTAKDGLFKIVIGREIQADCGCTVGKNMGVNTWAAFGGTDDNAIVDGDFAVLEDELQDVLKELIAANIAIVAIHNHMTHEQPRMLFLHYWGQGKAIDLAHGIKNALDKTSVTRKKLLQN